MPKKDSKKLALPTEIIANKIYLIRGRKVMLDRNLAALYWVETRVLNHAVTRNGDRFPNDFMFPLYRTEIEMISPIASIQECWRWSFRIATCRKAKHKDFVFLYERSMYHRCTPHSKQSHLASYKAQESRLGKKTRLAWEKSSMKNKTNFASSNFW